MVLLPSRKQLYFKGKTYLPSANSYISKEIVILPSRKQLYFKGNNYCLPGRSYISQKILLPSRIRYVTLGCNYYVY